MDSSPGNRAVGHESWSLGHGADRGSFWRNHRRARLDGDRCTRGSAAAPASQAAVLGFACTRREVSGQRLWGWARKTFGSAEGFFERFFVANYCPLMFMGVAGQNLTPDKLKAAEARPVFEACDRALRRTVAALRPRHVIGIGRFAADRARAALEGLAVQIGGITHPSPANPKANRGWSPSFAGSWPRWASGSEVV